MTHPTIQWLRPLAGFLVITLLMFGLFYSLCGVGAGQLFYREQANGSLIVQNGEVRGSYLVAQAFPDTRYFVPRPSAADYEPMAMGASNLALSNPALLTRIKNYTQGIRERLSAGAAQALPADLVTQSGSGIDPDISVQSALVQVPTVAKARQIPAEQLQALISELTQLRQFGLLGEERVNVMQLNTRLDQLGTANH